MSSTGNIREGMQVYGSDDQMIGTVERVHNGDIHVNGQHISADAIARVAQNRVYLKEGGARYMAQGGMRGTTQQTEGEVRVPVREERLDVEKRPAEVGEVQVRREVVEEQQSVPVELRREEVHVEQRDVADRPLRPGEAEQAFQEGTIRVPVRGEEAVVQKEAVVTGEVVINKEQTTERQEITDTVRRERVNVDENYQQARSGFQQHFSQRGQGRRFEEAEPNYRWGFETAYDERYAGREFDDVESDLRREYEQRGGRRGDSWEQLREEIREGWNRARGG